MDTATTNELETSTARSIGKQLQRIIKKVLILAIVFIPFFYFAPIVAGVFVACGLIDFSRNTPLSWSLANKYFLSRGILTWILSPVNLLVDAMTLTWPRILKLKDLPKPCQKELKDFFSTIDNDQLIQMLQTKMDNKERGMIFFKWYGKNIDTAFDVPQFHQKYRYIRTIGISAFNKHCSTTRHFGPLRLTLRVLYNLRPVKDDGVYIEVCNEKHYWYNNPMFIFDDTHIHQSFNECDQIRYCMFIDIKRSSMIFNPIIALLIKIVQIVMIKSNHVFYKKWKTIR